MFNPSIYTAGKVWHAERFKALVPMGFKINARWIYMSADHPVVMFNKPRLWQICYEDVRDCDYVLLYSEDKEEEHRGALVEIGMAFGMNKPVFAINSSKSLSPSPVSDVAFTHYHNFHWLASTSLADGADEAEQRFYNMKRGKAA